MGATNAPADGSEADSAEAEGEIHVDQVSLEISKGYFPNTATHKNEWRRKFYKHKNRFVDTLFEELVDDKDSHSGSESHHGGTDAQSAGCELRELLVNVCLDHQDRRGNLLRLAAIVRSAMDSCLVIVSGCVMFVTSPLMRKKNPLKYPVGKKRMEPFGVIVFATAMSTATIQLLITAVSKAPLQFQHLLSFSLSADDDVLLRGQQNVNISFIA